MCLFKLPYILNLFYPFSISAKSNYIAAKNKIKKSRYVAFGKISSRLLNIIKICTLSVKWNYKQMKRKI